MMGLFSIPIRMRTIKLRCDICSKWYWHSRKVISKRVNINVKLASQQEVKCREISRWQSILMQALKIDEAKADQQVAINPDANSEDQ